MPLTFLLRIILYVIAGIFSALLGWNIYQIALLILKFLSNISNWPFFDLLRQWPEMLLFPLITVFVAAGMVLNEIFISNPTRPSINLKVAIRPLFYTVIIGSLVGLIIGGLLQILYLPQLNFSEKTVRIVSWLMVGITVGFIEGITWQFHSTEAGDKVRYRKRFIISLFAASLSSVIAAGIFENIRNSTQTTSEIFQQIEDPLGFCILAALLGIAFTITTSPSYMVALRAGKGFEFRSTDQNNKETKPIDTSYIGKKAPPQPVISDMKIKTLKFVSGNETELIEEGLSIQLPENCSIKIGGIKKKKMPNEDIIGSDIYLPNTPPLLAEISINNREAKLVPNKKNYDQIEINFIRLDSANEKVLKHNTLITFYANENDQYNPNQPQIYRFVYYNRFLDPEG